MKTRTFYLVDPDYIRPANPGKDIRADFGISMVRVTQASPSEAVWAQRFRLDENGWYLDQVWMPHAANFSFDFVMHAESGALPTFEDARVAFQQLVDEVMRIQREKLALLLSAMEEISTLDAKDL